MTKRVLSIGALTLLLAAAGCASTRMASAGPTPNIGGDDLDPSSARNNTDPAVADPPAADTRYAGPITGTGSGQQQ